MISYGHPDVKLKRRNAAAVLSRWLRSVDSDKLGDANYR